MTTSDDGERGLLEGPGRIARGGARGFRASPPARYQPTAGGGLNRRIAIAQGRPQALLKITSFGRGAEKVGSHARYVTRNGKLELETESGERIGDPGAVRALIAEWAEEGFSAGTQAGKQRQARDTAHMVLGVPPGADRDQLSRAVRAFAAEAFEGHRYAWVRHDDTNSPHAHLILHMTDKAGRKPQQLRKEELDRLRGLFAAQCRVHGIEVDASRAWERGRAPRAKSQQIEYRRRRQWQALTPAERAERERQGKRPALDKTYKALEAAQRSANRGRAPTPWETRRRENVAARQAEYRTDADRLAASAAQRDGKAAAQLREQAERMRAFAASMRATPTRQQVLERELRERTPERGADLDR